MAGSWGVWLIYSFSQKRWKSPRRSASSRAGCRYVMRSWLCPCRARSSSSSSRRGGRRRWRRRRWLRSCTPPPTPTTPTCPPAPRWRTPRRPRRCRWARPAAAARRPPRPPSRTSTTTTSIRPAGSAATPHWERGNICCPTHGNTANTCTFMTVKHLKDHCEVVTGRHGRSDSLCQRDSDYKKIKKAP